MGELEELRDKIARLEAENAILRRRTQPSQAQLWAQVENVSNMGTWSWDIQTQRVGWSSKLFEILGFPEDVDPATVPFEEHILPEDRAAYREGRNRAMRGEHNAPVQYRFVRPDGRQIHAVQVAIPSFDADNNVTAFVGAIIDMTHYELAQEELMRAGRLEVVGRLASRVAHDFNNLLSVIMGNADLLLLDVPDSREALQIQIAASTGASLTRQLLAFNQTKHRAPVVVDVCRAVKESVSLIQRLLRDNVSLQTVPAAQPCAAMLVPGQLQNALVNLALNARDAMPEGGTLTLAVETSPEQVQVSVRDTGTGIPPELMERIFEPFFTTKPSDKGTGLGLASVRSFVQKSSGTLHVASEPGAGSTFTMVFPRIAAQPQAQGANDETPLKGSVLLVEDEPGVREMVSRILSGAGCAVHEASRAEQALALWPQITEQPRVLICSSRPLAERIRSRDPGLRVLFLDGPEDSGAGPVLPKPFSRQQLLQALRPLLA